ncbi:MAG: PLDc N-terminal domain-containing protein [Actinomycetota bacterium]
MSESLIILILLAVFATWVWAIVDIVRHSTGEWEAAGQSQIVWVLVVLFLGPLGLILYLAIARPRLGSAP